ncbi:Methylcrotonoyl-CoA carboxylase beta chain,mitochondrial [Waddlia chondrophila 2032/99]|uniref:Acetyl/propionyl-CoA carboxylase, beta subunit n=2 Tax=Waddlia chondrophila TaxID=71667 RepID=D6YUK8_WADCW|nr:acyl-CoA carboxylase subunit beta [Waddlia chondrophila]ADI37819.1 acetyl/propionyl-CoA carboxylase, beta subunit [Waddlia chondrophila WSU 86-1044]CCB91977.1 Methylcrotonoyl-CoA carboxylase beta chain,mitochondrial [Waddlia chondrophila 2032/99]
MTLLRLTEELQAEEQRLRQGGGEKGRERQRKYGRLTVRERLEKLLDDAAHFQELQLWAAYGMYTEWGGAPSAGVVAGIGKVCGRDFMVIANDATVKAGAMFPQSVKKILRAQRIAFECRLPIIYLVDSAGVFLPMQDEIFPDEDDFGRIFRNNSIISAAGIPQYAAIMGNCIAGGGYLPVLCDKLLMTKGSSLNLAGPALVKAAIGHEVDPEALGGAEMHASISGTVDFLEENDDSCLERLRALADLLPMDESVKSSYQTEMPPDHLYDLMDAAYDARDLLACIVDKESILEYKADYGKPLVTAFAKIDGHPVGVIANQRHQTKTGRGEVEIGGVIYADSADKAARFVMDCNQTKIPLIFFQDVMGFMVGEAAEQAGIIRSGAKLVNAVSNSIVPKITVVVGNSFGAGNYALCGKAYDPNFLFAWPNAKYAVMGADQAAGTLLSIRAKQAEKEENTDVFQKIRESYAQQMDIRYGAARGWIDAIIAPHETRKVLTNCLRFVKRAPLSEKTFHTGVMQV